MKWNSVWCTKSSVYIDIFSSCPRAGAFPQCSNYAYINMYVSLSSVGSSSMVSWNPIG